MATHSSILARKSHGQRTEEPGRLLPTGSQESDTTQRLNHHHHHMTLILCQGPFWTPQVCNPSGACEGHTSIFPTVEETAVQRGCLASVSGVRGRMRILDASCVAPGICFLNHLALLPHGADHVSVPEILSSQNERDLQGTEAPLMAEKGHHPTGTDRCFCSKEFLKKRRKVTLLTGISFFLGAGE